MSRQQEADQSYLQEIVYYFLRFLRKTGTTASVGLSVYQAAAVEMHVDPVAFEAAVQAALHRF